MKNLIFKYNNFLLILDAIESTRSPKKEEKPPILEVDSDDDQLSIQKSTINFSFQSFFGTFRFNISYNIDNIDELKKLQRRKLSFFCLHLFVWIHKRNYSGFHMQVIVKTSTFNNTANIVYHFRSFQKKKTKKKKKENTRKLKQLN